MREEGLTRRTALASFAALPLAACVHRPGTADASAARAAIRGPVESGAVPGAGLVVCKAGKPVFAFSAGLAQGAAGEAPPLAFLARTKMRVASVSKIVTALTAHRLSRMGILNLDADVGGEFSPVLRHTDFPDAPITLRQLLSHTASLQDPEVYWRPAPGRTEDLFASSMWREAATGRPGSAFNYCNFGYGLAAHVIERMTGERFDHVVRRLVMEPAGIDAGFAWSQVPVAERRAGATLYRKVDDVWQVQVDGPATLADDEPAVLKSDDFRLDSYLPGTNGTMFSPQGGLRSSLEDIAALVRMAAVDAGMQSPLWVHDQRDAGSITDGGYFSVYTAGLQIHPASDTPLPGHRLMGHHGEAYGLYSGAFHLPDLDAEIAFAVTGTGVEGGIRHERHPVVVNATAPLWEAAEQILRSL